MSYKNTMDLYELLPALYRMRDTEQAYKLRALLEIISDQADILKRDIDGLWDDMFIETCRDWVIPYIGDLVANNPLHEVAARRRADVAKTIYYRRRKGTLSMLEELARDVTGWGAYAVPFFQLLGWTQNLNHLRFQAALNPAAKKDFPDPFSLERVGTANLRNIDTLDLLNGPFDIVSHTVDVRAISRWEGWYNIRKIGFFLWRLRSYPVVGVTPRKACCRDGYHGYHFSPLGNPHPLFNRPLPGTGENGLSTEVNVPGPIRSMAFHFNKDDYYEISDPDDGLGCSRSIAIYFGSDAVPVEEIVCRDLSDWAEPPSGMVAVDIRLGRLAFPPGDLDGDVTVCYSYGFSADIGGGPYDRRGSLVEAEDGEREVTVCKHSTGCSVPKIAQALEDWADSDLDRAVITIADSATYEENLSIDLIGRKGLIIQAASGCRPHIKLLNGGGQPGLLEVKGCPGSRLSLNGLMIEGGISLDENVQETVIGHCTLVPGISLDEDGGPLYPGRASIIVNESNRDLLLKIDHCITGPLHLPEGMARLSVKDSIVDACDYISSGNHYAISSGKAIAYPDISVKPLPLKSWGSIEAIDIEGEMYFAGYSGGFLHKTSTIKRPQDGRLCRILLNNRDIKSFGYDGEGRHNLPLEEGYELALESIDVNNKIRLELIKDGQVVHSQDLRPLIYGFTIADKTFHYQRTVGSPADLVTIAVHIQDIIGWDDDSGVSLIVDGMWQISELPAFPIPLVHLPGPCLEMERTTVFGSVHARELSLASEVIFTAPAVAERRQAGCVRFSYLPESSRTPRRYRCQPDLALERRAEEGEGFLDEKEKEAIKQQLVPTFTSLRYGEPGYGQLRLDCPEEIRTGAEDGSEMGAFSALKQPQREDNLRIRLEEYLPFGLEAGFIYIT